MESIKELYKIGRGPSSSHTMGPVSASLLFKNENPEADRFEAMLFGSLSKTGMGHMTDIAIKDAFLPRKCTVIFSEKIQKLYHPNTMVLFAFDKNNNILDQMEVYSIGGGSIEIKGRNPIKPNDVYADVKFADVKEYCIKKQIKLCDYVYEVEGSEIKSYLNIVWRQMKNNVETGLKKDGLLPGGLNVRRKARTLYYGPDNSDISSPYEQRIVSAYAFSVAEENASGQIIATAPTCGSCGVVPAVLYNAWTKEHIVEEKIIDALATAGLIGNIIKTNASISGAECGCQAEIGSACSMAAAALGEIREMSIAQIEYAAEMAMEHNLGLTCDPLNGLVQIPCIERNAMAAMYAINACTLSNCLAGTSRISFDDVIKTMYETGKDLLDRYRETSEGGLAKITLSR